MIQECSDSDVVYFNETNIGSKEGKFLAKEFSDTWTAFWSNNLVIRKLKGYGMAIFVKNAWAIHIKKVYVHSPYLITITFQFRQCEIIVTNVYRCPNNDQISKEIFTYFNNTLLKNFRDEGDHYHIIASDFNAVINSILDKTRIQPRDDLSNPYSNSNKIGN